MTNFNVTVAERLNLFGVAPSDKWNEANWAAFIWGEGTNKVLVRYVALLGNDQITATDTLSASAQFNRTVSETIPLEGAPSSEVLTDGSGYAHVFPSGATDGEDRDPVSWSSGAAGSGSWTSQAAASTSWSET